MFLFLAEENEWTAFPSYVIEIANYLPRRQADNTSMLVWSNFEPLIRMISINTKNEINNYIFLPIVELERDNKINLIKFDYILTLYYIIPLQCKTVGKVRAKRIDSSKRSNNCCKASRVFTINLIRVLIKVMGREGSVVHVWREVSTSCANTYW